MIRKQKGFLLIVALILILIFSVIGVVATYLLTQNSLSAVMQLHSQQALYIADAGLESAAHQLTRATIANRTSCANITDHSNLTNTTFTGAAGPFTVTGTVKIPSTATTLSSAITASATTIPLTSSANYSGTGRIMIDNELIDYSYVSGNNLLNVVRGAAGTTAAPHANSAPVGQYQCNLQSKGGAPSLSPSGNTIGGMRTINESVQLPMAWAVSDGTSGTEHIMRWNAPTELSWNDQSISSANKDLDGIFALSTADAWAVGQSGVIFHWNGTSWASSSSDTPLALHAVYCVTSNFCWAVGASSTFDLWNGSSWVVQSSLSPSTPYNSVYCVAANDCWAVGDKAGSGGGSDIVAHWNGTAWSLDSSASALPSPEDLQSVWCVNSSFCEAVGKTRTFITYNGSAWSNQNASSLPNTTYNGVTCVSTTDCWAVGADGTIARWNGTTWSTSTTASVAMNGISCAAMNNTIDNCWAVGNNATSLYWDGSSWTSISNPLTKDLNSVSMVIIPQQPIAAWQEIFP